MLLVTLAIGTGANATVFSFVNALLLRPAEGVASPSSLMAVYTSDFSSTPYGDSSYPDFLSLQSHRDVFASLAASQDGAVTAMTVGDAAERVRASHVTGDYFAVLGLRPMAGRLLNADDTADGAPGAAVIGESLWRRAFGGSDTVLGTSVTVTGRQYTIVGVAPPRFTGLDLGRAIEMWVPLVAPSDTPGERENRGLTVIGRLRAGLTLAAAQKDVDTIAAGLAAEFPLTNRGTLASPDAPRPMFVIRHTRIDPAFRSDVTLLGSIIIAATSLVLVIACANVASLLLSRATARGREMAVRLALGASRGALVRQMLTESLVLAVGGGALGMLFALWTVGALPSFFPPEQASLLDARVDETVLAFTMAIALLSGVLFGLAPAFHTRPGSVNVGLRGDATGISDAVRGVRLRNVMVTVQVGLSCVLIVSTGLLTRSLNYAFRADLGYTTKNAVVATAEIPYGDMDDVKGVEYFRDLVNAVRRLPGIESAGLVGALPLSGRGGRRGFRIKGYEPQPGEDMELNINIAGDQYFQAMGIPLIAGRFFEARDAALSTPVAVVNDVLARRYFGGNAIGRRIRDSSDTELEIVGVVRTGKYRSLQESPLPVVYYPFSQSYLGNMSLVARTKGDPNAMVQTVRETMRRVRPTVPIFRTMTLDANLSEALGSERLTAALVTTCGGMALLLATVGVYGVMAFTVVRRSREIGVRLALGAQPRQIVALVLTEGLRLTALGVVVGLAGAAAGAQVLRSMLYGVSPADAMAFAVAPVVLGLVAILAAIVPIRRALGVDPQIVLRQP